MAQLTARACAEPRRLKLRLRLRPGTAATVFVDCRVVTLESIAGRLGGAKQVVVVPEALVTPAVRDELRRRGIELLQNSLANQGKTARAPVLLVAGPHGQRPGIGRRHAAAAKGSTCEASPRTA